MAMSLVSTVTVGSGGAASIEFTNIPQTGKDLVLLISTRAAVNNTYEGSRIRFNNNTTASAYTIRWLQGDGSNVLSQTNTDDYALFTTQGSATTASTFGNCSIYVSNYTSSAAKSVSIDSVTENNATEAWQTIEAAVWNQTAAISSIQLSNTSGNPNFVQHSTASLYIIS